MGNTKDYEYCVSLVENYLKPTERQFSIVHLEPVEETIENEDKEVISAIF